MRVLLVCIGGARRLNHLHTQRARVLPLQPGPNAGRMEGVLLVARELGHHLSKVEGAETNAAVLVGDLTEVRENEGRQLCEVPFGKASSACLCQHRRIVHADGEGGGDAYSDNEG